MCACVCVCVCVYVDGFSAESNRYREFEGLSRSSKWRNRCLFFSRFKITKFMTKKINQS
jgi:hypothetical protein